MQPDSPACKNTGPCGHCGGTVLDNFVTCGIDSSSQVQEQSAPNPLAHLGSLPAVSFHLFPPTPRGIYHPPYHGYLVEDGWVPDHPHPPHPRLPQLPGLLHRPV